MPFEFGKNSIAGVKLLSREGTTECQFVTDEGHVPGAGALFQGRDHAAVAGADVVEAGEVRMFRQELADDILVLAVVVTSLADL